MWIILRKNVNLSYICTTYLDWPIWNPSQHARQGTNDNLLSLKSKYKQNLGIFRKLQITDSNSFCLRASQRLGGQYYPTPLRPNRVKGFVQDFSSKVIYMGGKRLICAFKLFFMFSNKITIDKVYIDGSLLRGRSMNTFLAEIFYCIQYRVFLLFVTWH